MHIYIFPHIPYYTNTEKKLLTQFAYICKWLDGPISQHYKSYLIFRDLKEITDAQEVN
jgi:hypothetical protein